MLARAVRGQGTAMTSYQCDLLPGFKILVRALRAKRDLTPGTPMPCENFLYGFKAARRAARAANSARTPSLPLALPLRRRQRRSAGAKSRKPPGRH